MHQAVNAALGTIISQTRLLFIILASKANGNLMRYYCELVSETFLHIK